MNYWHEPIRIAHYSFPRFIGGPLDSITDSPFRRMVRLFSKRELLYTEMRHVANIANERTKSRALIFNQEERPLSFQVSATTPQFMRQALERIEAAGVDIIDLNIGCPARSVVKSGSGSALMADSPRLKTVLRELRQSTQLPFTVKMRAGYKINNAIEIAQLIEGEGASAIAIHPRLQTQQFAGKPDYDLVAQVKRSVSIPVIVSGNVVNWATAKMAYERTGVDGFLIGRGIWARPWKLQELHAHAGGELFSISMSEVIQSAIQHLRLMVEYYGGQAVYCFRKHLPFYLRGFAQASLVRRELMSVTDSQMVEQCLRQLIRD